jgi:hypothetical protein
MTDPYPNESANTPYDHLRSVSNTISDFGESITSFQFSTTLSDPTDPTMPSFTRPGSIRRRFLRIISLGRYSSDSAEDTEPLIRGLGSDHRYSVPADVHSIDRPVYTAHQSLHSSASAQTTIIHEVPSGTAPFSFNAFRDQHHGDYISDTEFDTPPSLEVAQGPTHPVRATRRFVPAPLHSEDIARNPTHPTCLRRDKSFMQCNVCKRILEYTQFHCPGCAARTLHHVPVSLENSHPDSNDNDAQPRTLQPRKGRQDERHDISTEESSWDTHGLEAGTESWTTTANDAVETVPPEAVQESSIQFGVDEEQQQGEMLHQTCHCCCDAGVTIVHHCCCASSSHTTGALCAQHRVVQGQPITADVACIGPVPVDHACKCRKRGSCHHYICCRVLGAEHARAVEAAGRECICCVEEGEEVAKEKMAWWVRWGKWFCCF